MKTSSIMHYWRPSNEIGEVLGFEKLEYTFNKVKLTYQIIKGGKLLDKYVCFTFNEGVLSLRFSDECHRSELNEFTFVDSLNPTSNKREELWPLYKMEKSEFLDWYLSKELGPGFGDKITDFVFVDQENVLEILSSYEPTVTIHESLNDF
ncbi:hypothetical protein [Rossellomorea vietnamensis]|uniref:hypothetical protein n=1 Tax=Rossellomorea vietnamensis TaxID=218284 RepID=UPI000554BC17|nr:hypothetical protein [Rossellomorea vietnamensis]